MNFGKIFRNSGFPISWVSRREKIDKRRRVLKSEKGKHQEKKDGKKKEDKKEEKKEEQKDFKGYVINLKVVEAKDVPIADANLKADPYLKVRLNTEEKKTSVKQNTLEPVWNEVFELPLLDRNSDVLCFALWDEDIAFNDELAHLKLKLRDLVPGRVCDQWFTMKNKKGRKNTQLHLVLHLGEKGKTPFAEQKIDSKVLNVRIIEAAEVPKADTVGKSDPFVKLGLNGGKYSCQTKVYENSDTPQWNEQFVIYLNDPKTDVFALQLWDHDVSRDDIISSTQISIGNFEFGKVVDDWWKLDPQKGFKTGGRIHIQFQVANANQATFE